MHSPVPFFTHSPTALSSVLDKAEAHATAKNIKPDVFPQLRLIADMFPLWRQITIATDHAKGASARLAGRGGPRFSDTETTNPQVEERGTKKPALLPPHPPPAHAS